MTKSEALLVALAGVSGAACVALGAFGAHGLADPQAKAWFDTASKWHGLHTLALLATVMLARLGYRGARLAAALFALGMLFFSGSLYALGLGGPRLLVFATPVGGALLIAGWTAIAVCGCISAVKMKRRA